MAAPDYGAMLDMFALQARRRGVVNRVVTLPLDPRSDDEVVRVYADAITPRTRLLMVCHIVNVTGQVLPVRRIADMAHARGVTADARRRRHISRHDRTVDRRGRRPRAGGPAQMIPGIN